MAPVFFCPTCRSCIHLAQITNRAHRRCLCSPPFPTNSLCTRDIGPFLEVHVLSLTYNNHDLVTIKLSKGPCFTPQKKKGGTANQLAGTI
ncbi:hypothetical protein DM01DRAFT_1064882 [Hesseltinella vesiculosa]|uniref:Uncharacterized protein n=1 Tax=Hesseltinella vesiculosa TaxID=101127 RepID=A0A1X2GEJ3_9FUNG|nr:hypothetical protein DM01DRAFT_1064882 [Hesseltinella vesiculosa]